MAQIATPPTGTDPPPFEKEEIRYIRLMTIFGISTRHIAATIPKWSSRWNSYGSLEHNQRRQSRPILLDMVDDERQQLQSSLPAPYQTADQFVTSLLQSEASAAIDDKIRAGFLSDMAVLAEGNSRKNQSQYYLDRRALLAWEATLEDATNARPAARQIRASRAWHREQQLQQIIGDKYTYMMSVVQQWWPPATAAASMATANPGGTTLPSAQASAAPQAGTSFGDEEAEIDEGIPRDFGLSEY